MDIRIFSPDILPIGIIDNYISLQWMSKYTSAGSFTLRAAMTSQAKKLISKGNLLYTGDKAGYIQAVQYDMADGGETITAHGKDLNGLLGQRINWQTLTYTGTAEGFLRQMVDSNAITATASRVIPRLQLGALQGYTETISKQDSYSNLLDALTETAEASGLGFQISLDPSEQKMLFEVYKGTDRTADQSAVPPAIFAREFENILSLSYYDSLVDYRNVALVGGAGEGSDRSLETVGTASGFDRYELFVDASGVQQTTDGTSLTADQYSALLQQNGTEALAQYPSVQTFDGEINMITAPYLHVGDLVTVRDEKWGVTANVRITEIQEFIESSGKTMNITFGDHIPTIYDRLRRG